MNALDPALPWQGDDPVSKRAAAYFQRQRFWDWTEADQAELDAWIAESTLHRAAWLRIKGIVSYTEHLAAVHPFETDRRTEMGGPLRSRFMIPVLLAASIALSAALAVPYLGALMAPPDRTYSTDVGGRTLLNFADRTQIELNTDTVVRFRMTGEERTVWLEKGEAWFNVSHNASNPFTVFVGKHRITDLGTEFMVRRGTDRLEVALLAGRATLGADGAPNTMLVPGDDAVATPVSMSVTRKSPQELADALAWRRGMLVFRNTRLSDVVKEFNRYNATKLVIADPSIADEKITADIRIDDYESFLRLAEAALSLRADRTGNAILISREPKKAVKRAP